MAAPKQRIEDERYCQYCFDRMYQRENESPSNYLKRVTCSKACGAKFSRPHLKREIKPTSRLGVTFGAGFAK